MGKYHLSTEKIFQPEISTKIKSLNQRIKRQFPFLKICIWSTSAINEFMHHQPGKYYTLIEVEKKSTEAVFYYLKEKAVEVYLEPNEDTILKYISTSKNPIIVKTLVTESPVQNAEGVDTITIEKMLVDIYCDKIIFEAQQGSELANIFRDAIDKYTVNENRMLRYANRRSGKSEINNFLNIVSGYRTHG